MVNAILGLIGTLLYPLFSIIFVVLNLLQNVFYSFAGIGTVYYGSTYSGTGGGNGTGMVPITGESDGGETSTGLIYYLLTSNIVKNIVISIAILGLFLLVIFTTLAFIKTIYSDKPKSWKDILTNAIKGLTNFIVLPVCCLLGVWVGNIILQAINGATSTGGTMYLDRKLFLSCAYNANTYRINTFGENSQGSADAYADIMATINAYNNAELNKIKVEENKNSDYYAEIVDQMYALDVIPIHNHITVGVGATSHHGYYQLWSINYLFLIVGGIFMMYVMVNITYGMIKRMFILLMLFVISPALCAMYPLDEGAAVKSWSGDVKKNILSAYGAVAGMNLFFSFMPIIQNINIAGSAFGAYMADWAFVSDILQLIILICGLFCVNDFISMISGYIGAGNAFSDGKSLRSNVKGAIQKQAKKVGSVAGAFAKAGGAAKVGGASAWFGSMASSATGGVSKSLGMDWGLKDTSKKATEEAAKKFNESIDKKESRTAIQNIKQDKDKYVDEQLQYRKDMAIKKNKPLTEEQIASLQQNYSDKYDKMIQKDTNGEAVGIDFEKYIKGKHIASKDDAVKAVQEATQLNGLNDKAQKAFAEAIAVEFNKNRGKNDKYMTGEDVMKEVNKKATAAALAEALSASRTGLGDKKSTLDTQTAKITEQDRVNAMEVKEMGIDVVRVNATERNANGLLTEDAKRAQEMLRSFNKVEEESKLKREMEDAVKVYEETMRRVAETQNESMKAAFISAADIIKNKLNQSIEPSKIADAIEKGLQKAGEGSKDKKQLEEIVKLLEQLTKES